MKYILYILLSLLNVHIIFAQQNIRKNIFLADKKISSSIGFNFEVSYNPLFNLQINSNTNNLDSINNTIECISDTTYKSNLGNRFTYTMGGAWKNFYYGLTVSTPFKYHLTSLGVILGYEYNIKLIRPDPYIFLSAALNKTYSMELGINYHVFHWLSFNISYNCYYFGNLPIHKEGDVYEYEIEIGTDETGESVYNDNFSENEYFVSSKFKNTFSIGLQLFICNVNERY